MDALYVVVRHDLGAGLQMAQACHAVREFTREHPADGVGDNLVVLETSLDRLHFLAYRARVGEKCRTTAFHEPDLGGELTAVAFGAGARKLLSELPLAGRARRDAA
jgi:hypothetical protein